MIRHFLILMTILSFCPIYGQKISPYVTLSSGEKCLADTLLLGDECYTYSLIDEACDVDWYFVFDADDSDDDESMVTTLLSEHKPSNKAYLSFKNLRQDVYLRRYPDKVTGDVYFKGSIQIRQKDVILDSVTVVFNLLPSIPEITVDSYDYIYDWKDGICWPNCTLTIRVKSRQATRYEFHQSFECLNEPDFLRIITCFDASPDPSGYSTIKQEKIDWGTGFSVSAVNKYGIVAARDTFNTIDYITDKAELEDMLGNSANIEYVKSEASSPLYEIYNGVIHIKTGADHTPNVSIYDLAGRCVYNRDSSEEIHLCQFEKGCYILRILCRNGRYDTAKFFN